MRFFHSIKKNFSGIISFIVFFIGTDVTTKRASDFLTTHLRLLENFNPPLLKFSPSLFLGKGDGGVALRGNDQTRSS